MRIHDSIAGLRAALDDHRRVGERIVLVPTMGNLHDGHIALMKQARLLGQTVVATIFVNRLQFLPGEDFERYPRTFQADCGKLAEADIDLLFAPDEAQMYPAAQTFFVEPPASLATQLEGKVRPGHFRGVATVVLKLFNIVQPDAAIFGKKDYQQLILLRNMVRELNLPIEVHAGETVRAQDGLALSSRNGYLTPDERREAPRLYRVLTKVVERIRSGYLAFPALEMEAMDELAAHGWQPDYIAVRKKIDLQFPAAHDSGLVVLAAARLGSTRLIDNLEV